MVNRKKLNPDASPQAAFGARLRRSRDARGWKQDDLGARMGYSGRHISAIETGRKPPTLALATSADVVFGLEHTDDTFADAWRKMRNGALLEGFPEYVGHEARAAEIRLFEVGAIPGLLQTPEYAAAIEQSVVTYGAIPPDQARERVAFLADRQAAMIRPLPPVVIVVLDESCIRRVVGGPRVMDAQLANLVDFAAQGNTVLQLAPYELGERRPFKRLVNLLTMPDRSVMSYVESETQGHLDREPASVLPLVRTYHQLQAVSLSQTATVEMINEVRRGTR
ncbi:helix-turn-helix domain-containing protein [Streptomyces uncialis]|uniref:helix-turn-helix domain-containing protein n=1 Tax=Streptomyces uncialis TaxID=1048205 RepID=UPI00386ACF35|nr:helix-turn-helix transcriptional regulator [Streptomyces uncialis]